MNKVLYFAGGCFWGTQKFFDQFHGVVSTQTGYANGSTANPSYEEVRYKHTGHTETVKVTFDPVIISTAKLIHYFFMTIDPFSVNKQGEDEGENYRTGIYYDDETLAREVVLAVEKEQSLYDKLFAVEVLPLQNFYTAEEYHQKYLNKHPDGYCHIKPYLLHLEDEK